MKRVERQVRREDVLEQMKYSKLLAAQETAGKENMPVTRKKQKKEWGLVSLIKKIEVKTQMVTQPSLRVNDSQPVKSIRNWDYTFNKNKIVAKIMPTNIYYPPNCSGYDIAYSHHEKAIYIYGGISCSSSLTDGIKAYFYKYFEGKWSQIKPDSTYNPLPRYGHTLTAFQKELILFGGVSQYKEKLKDRCFYSDCSTFSTSKNNWRAIETTGLDIKSRKNHSSCAYGKYYLVYGGLDESEQIINCISWLTMDGKKSRWRQSPLPGRFNHKMVVIEPQNGKDFICIFGGRNSKSQIINSMFFVPLVTYDSDLIIKEPVQICHTIAPRQMPIMGSFLQGFIILGGINTDNEVVEDCWYCNNDKQTFTKIYLDIDYKDLRGAKACSLMAQNIYVMAGSNTSYKALQLLAQK